MPLLVSRVGCTFALQLFTAFSIPGNVMFRLFSNPVVLDEDLPLISFIEVNLPGYAAVTVAGATWQFTPVAAGGAIAQAPPAKFSIQGNGQCYGYVVTDLLKTTWLWAELFPNPPVPLLAGGTLISVVPTLQCG